MTRQLDKLEELNFIKRNRYVTNRRLIEVATTLQGLAQLKSMAAEVRKCNREQLGHLSKGKLESLIAILCDARQPHENDYCGKQAWPGNF